MGTILYRAEAKGIQEWILSSDRLRELKGGSAIIDRLPDAASRLITEAGGKVITNAAGAVEAHLPDAAALEKVAAVWPMLVELQAPGLALVQAWVPLTSDTRAARGKLMAELARARNLAIPSLPLAGPLVARSARTGLPASDRLQKGSGHDLADPAVARKVAEVDRMRRDASRDPFDNLLQDANLRFIDDTTAFGEGYVSVVHIDGNGIGQRIMALGDGDIAGFSQALTEATRASAAAAFNALARLDSDSELVLARPIVLGGDDLTAIVAAKQTLTFVRTYLETFRDETRRRPELRAPNGLTAAAGIAIVKIGFPFHAAHELAESLCKGAKRGVAAGAEESTLLFHRVTTANPEVDWSDILQQELAAETHERRPARLSDGPYSLDRLAALEALHHATSKLPRGSIREWLRLTAEDPTRARPFWGRMKEVAAANADGRWSQFESAMRQLDHNPGTGWREQGNGYATALLDASLLKFLSNASEAS
jgi:hypothetical protein